MQVIERIQEYVKANPGQTATAIGHGIGHSAANVSSALKRLSDRGLIKRSRLGTNPKAYPWVYEAATPISEPPSPDTSSV